MGHKDLRLGQIVYMLVFYKIHFLGFFHWTVSNLLFCCVTVKTIYSWKFFSNSTKGFKTSRQPLEFRRQLDCMSLATRHNNQLVTNNLDCHSWLLFQSQPPT